MAMHHHDHHDHHIYIYICIYISFHHHGEWGGGTSVAGQSYVRETSCISSSHHLALMDYSYNWTSIYSTWYPVRVPCLQVLNPTINSYMKPFSLN